jgi:hypothetical protein
MFPELLRFSSSSHLLDKVPDCLKNIYKSTAISKTAPSEKYMTARMRTLERLERTTDKATGVEIQKHDIWEGWGESLNNNNNNNNDNDKDNDYSVDDEYSDESDDFDVSSIGL